MRIFNNSFILYFFPLDEVTNLCVLASLFYMCVAEWTHLCNRGKYALQHQEVHLHCVAVEVLNFYISPVLRQSPSQTSTDAFTQRQKKKASIYIDLAQIGRYNVYSRKQRIALLRYVINFKSRLRLMIHSNKEESPFLKLFKVLTFSTSGYILSCIPIRSRQWHGKKYSIYCIMI